MDARITEALELHKKWLESNGEEGKQFCWSKVKDCFSNLGGIDLKGINLSYANLSNADLYNADLSDTNLSHVILFRANLRRAVMERADLSYADLRYANLSANLKYVNLSNANLRHADLSCCILSYADLSYADLFRANLYNTPLSYANLNCTSLIDTFLRWADLSYADLRYADLSEATLSEANLSDAKNLNTVTYNETTAFFASICPEEGSYIGFKVAEDKIVKLEIPEDALRSSGTTRKCRASKAKVLSITNLDGTPSDVDSVASGYDNDFIYKVGETVEVKNFDTNRWNECSTGIHHFITRREAVNYST